MLPKPKPLFELLPKLLLELPLPNMLAFGSSFDAVDEDWNRFRD